MVGNRNEAAGQAADAGELIELSDGGESEQAHPMYCVPHGAYRTFRWWGIGTIGNKADEEQESLSNFPMVGNRNCFGEGCAGFLELIELSDGGESEPPGDCSRAQNGAYRTFRWWGIGTAVVSAPQPVTSLSNFPMVGNRNCFGEGCAGFLELIELSDGGESEPPGDCSRAQNGAYRTFRWWGIGTIGPLHLLTAGSLSNFPMVGNRNYATN